MTPVSSGWPSTVTSPRTVAVAGPPQPANSPGLARTSSSQPRRGMLDLRGLSLPVAAEGLAAGGGEGGVPGAEADGRREGPAAAVGQADAHHALVPAAGRRRVAGAARADARG